MISRPRAEDWDDWRWQAKNVLTSVADLAQWIELSAAEEAAVSATRAAFRMAVTPYYASLMDPADPGCPIRRQAIPHSDELAGDPEAMADPLGEVSRTPVPGVVHRYPDRILLLVNNVCPVYCRFCTRKRLTKLDNDTLGSDELEAAYAYVAANPAIKEVILSGGDPLLLSDRRLSAIVGRLHGISTVDLVRIHSRLPVVMPQRITPELVDALSRHRPLWLVTHFNHPAELTLSARAACERLVDAGIPVENQSVLLKGVNDDKRVLAELFQTLVTWRVRPYYLHHCDLAEGVGHFRTPASVGPTLMAQLRGTVSGLALPQFVIDTPGGAGKVPVTSPPGSN
jgi:lysine 2,3-aminomutase